MDKPVETRDELRTWSLERTLPYDQAKVWEAITDREEMRHWSPVEVVGTRSLGAPITVARLDIGEPNNGHIVAFERPRLFAYTAGGRTLTWEAFPDDGEAGVTLRFLATLDAEVPGPANHGEWDLARKDFADQLDALEEFLAGSAPVSEATRPYLAARGV